MSKNATQKERICPVCEKPFLKIGRKTYCSKSCRQQARYKRDQDARDKLYAEGKRYRGHKKNDKGQSLCWKCKNCYSGCSWSRSFVPVKDWDAEEFYRTNGEGQVVVTYLVKDCPKFKRDERFK